MYKEIWTIGRILQWTEQYFQSKEMDTPRLDGEVLLCPLENTTDCPNLLIHLY